MDMREMNMWGVRGLDLRVRQDSAASQESVPLAARAAAREVGFVPRKT